MSHKRLPFLEIILSLEIIHEPVLPDSAPPLFNVLGQIFWTQWGIVIDSEVVIFHHPIKVLQG
jgi:hypothetical protein